MSNFETPFDFPPVYKTDGVELRYSDLMEVGMGGPLAGFLTINGERMGQHKFGGPALAHKRTIYVPIHGRRLWGSGFKVAEIDRISKQMVLLGRIRPLIFLDRVEDGKIFFFKDFEKKKEGFEQCMALDINAIHKEIIDSLTKTANVEIVKDLENLLGGAVTGGEALNAMCRYLQDLRGHSPEVYQKIAPQVSDFVDYTTNNGFRRK